LCRRACRLSKDPPSFSVNFEFFLFYPLIFFLARKGLSAFLYLFVFPPLNRELTFFPFVLLTSLFPYKVGFSLSPEKVDFPEELD